MRNIVTNEFHFFHFSFFFSFWIWFSFISMKCWFHNGIIVFFHFRLLLLSFIIIAILSISTTVDGAFPFISQNKHTTMPPKVSSRQDQVQFSIGPCKWIFNGKCPDSDIKFYLYTRKNQRDRQYIFVDESWEKSNLSESYFNSNHPVKIILHGYNSDMFLTPLIQMKEGLSIVLLLFFAN